MIGYDTGGGGGIGWTPPSAGDITRIRDAWDATVETVRDRVADIFEPVFDLVSRVVDVARWVLETVEIVYAVPIEGWRTAGDERVCPECGPLDGATWEAGVGGGGPQPPLHTNCRCWRGVIATEWRVRFVDEWRLRWTTRTVWDWVQTGWA